MRLSCNGCRVLRKGCSENCTIRACLQWIKSPEAQANVTLFLAKFYGRAGLLNLISVGPDRLRPSIFKSLLQEACGRMVNPIYGSSGLISTGNWHLCEAAVEAVLNGSPITQIPIESTIQNATPILNICDIRHVSKKDKESLKKANKVKNQNRFKRSKLKLVPEPSSGDSVSQCRGSDSGSVENVEDTLDKPNKVDEVGFDLKLDFQTFPKMEAIYGEMNGFNNEMVGIELKLGLPEV